jgi:heme exporter protein C
MLLKRLFTPLWAVALVMFAMAPLVIARAEYESTMLLVQKIFYFHVPSWIVNFLATFTCGIASAIYLFRGKASADRIAVAAAELAVLFGLFGLTTGPLWGRKAWGVWWQWDARLTLSLVLWMIMVSYLLLRKYGGPGSEKLAAGVALFAMANVPFVYWSVNMWRTVHPPTTVVQTLPASMNAAFWWCAVAFLTLYFALLATRVRLEEQRAALEELYLATEED